MGAWSYVQVRQNLFMCIKNNPCLICMMRDYFLTATYANCYWWLPPSDPGFYIFVFVTIYIMHIALIWCFPFVQPNISFALLKWTFIWTAFLHYLISSVHWPWDCPISCHGKQGHSQEGTFCIPRPGLIISSSQALLWQFCFVLIHFVTGNGVVKREKSESEVCGQQ